MPDNAAAEARTVAILKALGREIAAERIRRDLTQLELAELTAGEVSKRQVGKIERGQAGQLSETFMLATALGVQMSELIAAAERQIA